MGSEFARQLAPYASRIVLVARRNDRLESLASELRHLHPTVDIRVFAADLSQHDRRTALADWLASEKIHVDFLVNNAGLGDHGDFSSGDWKRIQAMLDLNITALTHLTHILVERMLVKGRSAILNVSSVAGFFPIPQMAVYAATKAYVTSLSEALGIELRPKGITVTALCPTVVKTNIFRDGRIDDSVTPLMNKWVSLTGVSAEGVAATTLKALDKGRLYVLPQVDARLIWRAKRYLPATYARGAGLLSRFTLAKP